MSAADQLLGDLAHGRGAWPRQRRAGGGVNAVLLAPLGRTGLR